MPYSTHTVSFAARISTIAEGLCINGTSHLMSLEMVPVDMTLFINV